MTPGRTKSPTRSQSTIAATPKSIGKLGMSQAVSMFGPGSIYVMRSSDNSTGDLVLHSVMIAGLESWPDDSAGLIREQSLEKSLGVTHFRLPPVEERDKQGNVNKAIPAIRFPEVHYCSNEKCGTVGRVGTAFTDGNTKGVLCSKSNCRGKGIPFRFVLACHDKADPLQPGHIDDFPYEWWAHECGKSCESPSIVLSSSEEKSGLEGMWLYCSKCDKKQSLAGIFSEGALHNRKCWGKRPWLGDSEKDCKRPLRVLQRGAANVYFPVSASAISIPPYSDWLINKLDEVVGVAAVANIRKGDFTGIDYEIKNIRNIPRLDDPDRYTNQQLREGLLILAGVHESIVPRTEAQQKQLERNALIAGRSEEEAGEFEAIPVDFIPVQKSLDGLVGHLIQVHRLREVRALRGFQRVEPSYGGDPYQLDCAPLSRNKTNWLPAIEVRGEGIYLELDAATVARWELSHAVKRRMQQLHKNYQKSCANAGRDADNPPSARHILVHTLSHMMIKQLSLECGYSGSSLRERLYVSGHESGEVCAGFLIYTASSSADGTLGGLVSQGDPSVFEGMLCSAVASARWCSSDPLCIESEGQGNDALNLAACHACALIAETSCECGNMLLDRGLVVGTPDEPDAGFFQMLVADLNKAV
jgi:hypothetical protein